MFKLFMIKNFIKLKVLLRNMKKRCYKDSNNRYRIFMFYRNCINKKISYMWRGYWRGIGFIFRLI